MRMQEEKLQQLHREKVRARVRVAPPAGQRSTGGGRLLQHTLETALLSASQELSEQNGSNATTNTTAVQNLVQQRDVLQNGLLSTCRELSRVSTVSSASSSALEGMC